VSEQPKHHVNPEPSREELLEKGHRFPIEWVTPLIRATANAVTPFGTATFVGATSSSPPRHVIEPAFQSEVGEGPFALLPDAVTGKRMVRRVLRWEPHPDDGVDLGFAQLENLDCTRPFVGIGLAGFGVDYECIGFPDDLLSRDRPSDLNHGRYLRGDMTRSVESGLSGAQPAFEVSLAIAGPVGYYLFGGEHAKAALDSFKGWLVLHNAAVAAVLVLFIGADLIGKGIPPLST
jgi:hypothetical protein